jgi:hypothetical protein
VSRTWTACRSGGLVLYGLVGRHLPGNFGKIDDVPHRWHLNSLSSISSLGVFPSPLWQARHQKRLLFRRHPARRRPQSRGWSFSPVLHTVRIRCFPPLSSLKCLGFQSFNFIALFSSIAALIRASRRGPTLRYKACPDRRGDRGMTRRKMNSILLTIYI